MYDHPEVEWLLDCEPTEVQLEATRRSFYGFSLKDHKDDDRPPQWFRSHDQPARGWGHILEMRLGKTPVTLNEYMLAKSRGMVNRLVVMSPNTYKEDWRLEAEKFGVDVPAFALDLPKAKKLKKELDKLQQYVLVVNYDVYQHEHGRDFLKSLAWGRDMVAYDESIKLKNPESVQGREGLLMSRAFDMRRILTGKPITQGPADVYNQYRCIGAFEGQNYYAFRNTYCIMGGYKRRQIKGAKNEEKLTERMNEWSFIAKRRDWGNVTEPEYYPEYIQMSPEQKKFYDMMDKDLVLMLDNGDEVAVEQIVSKLMKLQQISSGFIYDEQGNARDIMPFHKTAKFERLLSILDEADSKVVIPYHYNKTADNLIEHLAKFNPCVIRSGPWMDKNGIDVVSEKKRFNHDPASRVMICNLEATKYGHDLTGNPEARNRLMCFYEQTYSLDTRSQIEMRITAREQDWTSVYLDFISSEVEGRAVEAMVRKEDISAAVLGYYTEAKRRI